MAVRLLESRQPKKRGFPRFLVATPGWQEDVNMPTGPRGEKRPADVIGGALMVAKISVGDLNEEPRVMSGRVRSGKAGGAARAELLSPEKRQEIAKKAADSRWARG